MFVTVRAYGLDSHRLFKSSNARGSFVEYAGFDVVPPVVAKVASSFEVIATVASNGYNLGTHPSFTCAEVLVTATGNTVTFVAPTLDVALRVWNEHAKGIGEGLAKRPLTEISLGTPFEIRVYGEDRLMFPHRDGEQQYTVVKTFTQAASYKGAIYFRVGTVVPMNYHKFGIDFQGESGDVEVLHTGMYLSVSGTSLPPVQEAWNAAMLKLHACVLDEHAQPRLIG